MSLPLAIGLYFICWWVAFFAVLPFTRRHDESETELPPGVERAAPTHFNIWALLLVTTVVTTIIFFILYMIIANGLVSLDRLPI